MLENVVRHLEMGKSRMRAAFDGAREIGFAILATTISLVAVFVPVAFLTGTVGRLFNEFGLTVAVAVTVSGFVALTLSPMLCSRILKPIRHTGEGQSGPPARFDRFFDGLETTYDKVLGFSLRHRALTIVVGGGAGGSERVHLPKPAPGAGAHRGPGDRLRHRHRSRRVHPRVHRPLHADGGGHPHAPSRAAGSVHRNRSRVRGPGPGHQRLHLPEPGRSITSGTGPSRRSWPSCFRRCSEFPGCWRS